MTARSGVASGEEREAFEYKEVEILAIGLGEIFDGLVVEGKGEVLGKLWQPKLGSIETFQQLFKIGARMKYQGRFSSC